ncbi:hypothetical protein K1719_039165 [Acacia pycnantha]|nr:hypothetical protein K1719_039165 [Acacia pycnantha]
MMENPPWVSKDGKFELGFFSPDSYLGCKLNNNKSLELDDGSQIAQLLDSGNLVLRNEKDQNPENYLWQSFDYLSHVFLPGMKLGWNLRTGLNRCLIAWKNGDDPCPSDFICELQLHSYKEIYVWQGRTKSYRSGPWNGDHFVDTPSSMKSFLYSVTLVSNKDEVYYMYNPLNESIRS